MTAPPSRRGLRIAVLAAFALLAMVLAASRMWVCDDAFISLRYAENLTAGHGLVFNLGERVEGYSNPSWTLLCALAIRCGLDPVLFAQWLGILCLGALVPVTAWAGARLLPGDKTFLPLAAIAVALHPHLQDFASCGLETLGFVLLVTIIAGLLVRSDSPRALALASVVCVMAAVTRPDGAVVGALAGGLALTASLRRKSLGPVIAFAAPGFLLFVPFLTWRFLYYNELLPNTFYAKSAQDPYAQQGWFYLQLFLNAYWVLWPAVVALPAMLFLRRLGVAMPVLAALCLGYLGFVVWVGGDFMFARFCLPVTPLLYLALEAWTRRCGKGAVRWLVVAVVAGGTVFCHIRADLSVVGQSVRGVADERAQYPASRTDAIRATGRRLGELLAGTEARVAFSGTQAMLVYEAKVPYALEAVTGLTDKWLARQPVGERGHVGHEKGIFRSPEATEYALRTQGVHLFLFDWPDLTMEFPFLAVEVDGVRFTVVRWERAIMSRLLGQPGVHATDLEAYLDDYVRDLDSKAKDRVAAEFPVFERVYFRWHGEDARRAKIVQWLAR